MLEHEKDAASKAIAHAELLAPPSAPAAWCYLYELSFTDHLAIFAKCAGLGEVAREFGRHNNAIKGAVVSIARGQVLDAAKLETIEGAEQLKEKLPALFALAHSITCSLRCVLFYGCYLNVLVERVRELRDDAALFAAVRIDPTVVGCPSVVSRLSEAALGSDKRFWNRMRAALSGKLKKREQANFQKMRLVLKVLSESGAQRLSDDRLSALFIDELRLYARHSARGDVIRNLRKFANRYMHKDAST